MFLIPSLFRRTKWYTVLAHCVKGGFRFLYTIGIQVGLRYTVVRLKRSRKVRVAILVQGTGGFQFARLVRLMLADGRFVPAIVVVPSFGYGTTDVDSALRKNYEDWRQSQFADIVTCAKLDDGYLPIVGNFDLCFTTSVYEWQMHENYRVSNMSRHGVLVVAMPYFFDSGTIHDRHYVEDNPTLSYLWRYYAVTDNLQHEILRTYWVLKHFKAVRRSGMPKLDELAVVSLRTRTRKVVLICPHHSVVASEKFLNISNFLDYSDFILSLPSRYPQIDWIFRPHPLLKGVLVNNKIWTECQWNEYIEKLCRFTNMSYIPTGSVSDLFINSDAMIQDCGSFLTEYHCVGHPQCYVLKSREHLRRQFLPWGQELLSYAYTAFSKDEILKFIDKVVLGGQDFKKQSRKKFVKEKLMLNYPFASEMIFRDIVQSLRWNLKSNVKLD